MKDQKDYDALIARLQVMARHECFYDDEDPDAMVDDYAGGNVDDAFECGEHAGNVMIARDVLTALGETW